MLTKVERAEIIAKFGGSEKNSGTAEVQVALLTARINYLTTHFASNKKDHHSKRGLMKMIGQRRRLLKYINTRSTENYAKLIKELGLRK